MIQDNIDFQTKYEFDKEPMTYNKLDFRMDLLTEEFQETHAAFMNGDAEEWVDGHIDLIVIALGNLHLAGVDAEKAWKEVFRANMSKVRGIKPGREQSGGFDVIKPEGWVGPNHGDNHGNLESIFASKN
jgi:NTP pyrophosphatase (non-canonical NTP hydrolase)